MLADAYPNFSICGIPYHVSGEVADLHHLAHRSRADLEAIGIGLLTDTTAQAIDVAAHQVTATDATGAERTIGYDRLVVATGARPSDRPSPASTGSAPPTGSICCTPWATPTPSWTPAPAAGPNGPCSSAPAT